jgi:two-component system chemotaxis sensor kinase CheA
MIVPEGYDALLRLLVAPEAAGVSGARSELTRDALRVGGLSVSARAAERDATRGLMPREASVRVRTNRLDRLIDLVGELVIAQSMLVQDEVVRHGGYHALARKVGHAGKLVRELHDLSMSLRMVPLRGLFQKMTRLVRDLAQKTGKQVELVIEGEETEIDRHMVDVIADPLVHMVRNAVDHGIESPDRRAASGKARAGTLRIAARHAGGNVVVELEDDGQGLDPDRIARKALALGLIDADRTLTSNEAFELIFAPGFSTAEAVTDVSGRGVGLDVVRRNIEALRGRIEIDSEPGRGTRFSLRLPLTLAITDGMLVRVGDERYIVPTVHIHMSFRPERGMLSTVAGRGELVMLRGDALPIVRLHRVFGVPSPVTDPTEGLLMIVGDGERRSALLVDELLGQQQVVAKPLGDGVGAVPGISGGAILGDGRVGLILDVGAIVNLARRSPSPRRESVPAAARSVA